QMDLNGTLSALIRRPAVMQPTAFPFSAFLHHPLMTSLPFPLGSAMDPSLFGVTPAEPQSAVTPKKARLDSPCSPLSQSSTVSSTQLSSPQASPARKLAKPIPDEKKDDAYYERRRRNNDAAKRSRDARRFKEELIAQRATRLEQENGQLRGQNIKFHNLLDSTAPCNVVALLKSETARLQLLLFSRQQLSAVTATKTDNKSESIDALLHNVRATVLPSEMEAQL
ncbi:basic region leucine zipper, partial [Teladorsagia circumcincta]